ncbi:hypothetical protein CB1_001907034 [Camelus ferus]|nr:hypothetical protein CB1_001907034 [Camelus ferus]
MQQPQVYREGAGHKRKERDVFTEEYSTSKVSEEGITQVGSLWRDWYPRRDGLSQDTHVAVTRDTSRCVVLKSALTQWAALVCQERMESVPASDPVSGVSGSFLASVCPVAPSHHATHVLFPHEQIPSGLCLCLKPRATAGGTNAIPFSYWHLSPPVILGFPQASELTVPSQEPTTLLRIE